MSYVGGVRFRYDGPAEVCSRYNHVARVLIERTYAMYNIGGQGAADAATHTQVLLDGTVVKVTVFANALPIVTITATADEQEAGSILRRELQYYFHTDDESITTGARYLPASIDNAYDRVADEGRWQSQDLPPEENWLRQAVRVSNFDAVKVMYFSLDIMPDGYPRYVTVWSDGAAHRVKPGRNDPYDPPSAYTVNGKIIDAPGPVMGAIKDAQQDVVFVANITSGLAIEKYFWDVDALPEPDWTLDWSSNITDAGVVDGLANTMRIRRDGLTALFATRVKNSKEFNYYPVLTEIDLVTGAAVKIYGSEDGIPTVTRNQTRTVGDTDFPDDTVYDLYTTTEITAGTTTSTTVTGDAGDTTLYRAMPRVGDKFYIGGGGNNSDNDGSIHASVIQITSVTFTPEQYSGTNAVYTGSIAPYEGTSADIEFTYIQVGTEGTEGTVPTTHAANRRLRYVNSSGAVTWDYRDEITQTTVGEYLFSYGYDENDNITYAVIDLSDSSYSYLETLETVGNSLIQEITETSVNNATLKVMAGAQIGQQITVSNHADRVYLTDGFDNLSFPSDPNRFSGLDFEAGTGTMRAYVRDIVTYPSDVEIPSFSASAVNGTSTDDVVRITRVADIANEAVIAIDSSALVEYIQDVYDSTAIDTAAYDERLGDIKIRALEFTGVSTPAENNFLQKGVLTQAGWHLGVHRYTHRVVSLDDFSGGSGNVTPTRPLGETPKFYLATASFTATPLWVSYGTSGTVGQGGGPESVAADPFHNVIMATDRERVESPAYTVRQDGYGYLYRATGDHTSDDPRSVFGVLDGGGAVTGDSVYPVFWGALLTAVTKEDATGDQKDGDVIDNRNETRRL